MTLSEATKSRIKELCKKKKMNVNKLATMAGMNPSTIRSILKDRCKAPNSQTVFLICIGFEMSLKEFYDAPVFENLEDD